MATTTFDLIDLLRNEDGSGPDVDFLRNAVSRLLSLVMDSEVSNQIGAAHGERAPARVAQRNGYRPREWDTRVGTVELAIPRLRTGSYFPSFLEARRRSEHALLAVIQQAYIEGVSTRRVDDLVRSLGCEGISKSQVSRICEALDEEVAAFRNRPLDCSPYPYLWLDALTQKVREGGRIVNVALVVATGVNADGRREVLGLDVGTAEDGAFWLQFLRGLVARGLAGVQLVTSDAHLGLKAAIGAIFSGASWQRCRTHFMTNLLSTVPKSSQPFVATLVRSIYQQQTPEEVWTRHRAVVDQLHQAAPRAAALLADAEDILAFTSFPQTHWRQIWSNNPQERLNKEIRRRTDVVVIFPNRDAVIRLVGAILDEQNTEWAAASRRYLSEESMNLLAARTQPPPALPEVASDSTLHNAA